MTNPFDLRGPEFLQLYLTSLLLAAALSLLLRYALRAPGGPPPLPLTDDDPYQLAILQAGLRRAAEAAIASLVHRRVLSVDPAIRRLQLVAPRPAQSHPAEDAVYLAFDAGRPTLRAEELRSAVARELLPLAQGLQDRGLAPTPAQSLLIQFAAPLPLLLVLLEGATKWVIGVSRNRPVGYLTILMILTALAIFPFVRYSAHATRRGSAYLRSLRRRTAALRAAAARPTTMLSPADIATAVALYGLDAVAYGPLADLATTFTPPKSTSSSSCSTSSCSISSCGTSCGSSCGSGCGGGCGGCGG